MEMQSLFLSAARFHDVLVLKEVTQIILIDILEIVILVIKMLFCKYCK